MRECAVKGYPLYQNFTVEIPSTVRGDHFPTVYEHRDFGTCSLLLPCHSVLLCCTRYEDRSNRLFPVTPVQEVEFSGLYGWGSILAWSFALVAAAFAGIRPPPRRKPGQASSARSTRFFRACRRWLGYIRRDLELLACLTLPCVAASDILLRRRRVSPHQIFMYGHPAFVPASDSKESAADILTIRAAIVVVNHFVMSAVVVTILPWVLLCFSRPPTIDWRRHVLRTIAISATLGWCLIATHPLYSQEFSWVAADWYGGCALTNAFLSNSAATFREAVGVDHTLGHCRLSCRSHAGG
jgi:hypothetical protein